MDATGKKPPTLPQTCAVCGETSPQVAIHYSRLLCNGCRAFFKRTVQGKMKVSSCKLRGECKVNPASRKDCKPCRYQACLRAGVDINKVQPVREPSTESTSRERKNEEEEDSSKTTQSRLETLPPLFPKHYQYPTHHSNPLNHPYSYHPTTTTTAAATAAATAATAAATTTTTNNSSSSSSSAAITTAALANFYPVPLIDPLMMHHHHHNPYPHPYPHYSSAFVPVPSSNASQTNIVPIPLHPTDNTNNFGFNAFNIPSYEDQNGSTNGHRLYHNPRFSATPSPFVFPFINVFDSNDTPHQTTHSHPENITHLTHFPYPQTQTVNILTNNNTARNQGNYQHTPSYVQSGHQTNEMAKTTSSHSALDLRHIPDIKPFPRYGLTTRPTIVNTLISQSEPSTSVTKTDHPHPSTYDKYSPGKSGTTFTPFAHLPRNTQKSSSAFMIDTLLEQQHTANTNNTVSKPSTSHNSTVSNNNTQQSRQSITSQQFLPENDNSHVPTNDNTDSETRPTTPPNSISKEIGQNMILSQQISCSNASQLSKIMSPIPNDGEEDDDDIFLHPNTHPSANNEEDSNIVTSTVLNNRLFSGIVRERLTSTPNQKRRSSCDSSEVELNVVDIVNTPSPINNTDLADDNEEQLVSQEAITSSLKNGQATETEPNQEVNSNASIKCETDLEDEAVQNAESNTCDSVVSDLVVDESVTEKDDKTNADSTSQHGCSQSDGDDSGLGSRCHSYNKSSTTSSSTSTSNSNNTTTSMSVTEKSHLVEEVLALDQSHKNSIELPNLITESPDSNSACNDNGKSKHSTSDNSNSQQNDTSGSSESRGSCPTVPLKRSTPRKWKRFSSNENLPLVPVVNSPKRVKCSSPSVLSPNKSDTTLRTALTQRIAKDEHCAIENHSPCRERLVEIKNFENTLDKIEIISDIPSIETSSTSKNETSSNSRENGTRMDEKETMGDNCTFTDEFQNKTSSVPLNKTDSMSSFLDLMIQRIRNADSDEEVKKAKKDLERFYSSTDFK